MATAASTCDLAVLLVDARSGVATQTRRHAFIATLLGIRHLVVAVNKMDLVGWDREVFERVRKEFTGFVARLEASDVTFLPLSALTGENVVRKGSSAPWYQGPPLLEYLETVHVASDRNLVDLRLPVQSVLRCPDGGRAFAGTIASGILRVDDEVAVLPSPRTSRVTRILGPAGDLGEAFAPMAVAVSLEDELDAGRGDVLTHPGNLPSLARDLEAMLVWMDEKPLETGRPYQLRIGTSVSGATVSALRYAIDVTTLKRVPADSLGPNEIGRAALTLTRAVPHDPYARNRSMGALVLEDPADHRILAAGMVLATLPSATAARPAGPLRASLVTPAERQRLLGQRPVTVWLTGLAASGKSSIAFGLERRLVDAGHAASVLDGTALRNGISHDLGFGSADRTEAVLRAAGIARILNDAGLVAIVALVSPIAADRQRAREIVGGARFVEVHCAAPLPVCEARDEDEVYARARRGELGPFPGVTSPYEAPEAPELNLPTHEIGIDEAIERVYRWLEARGGLSSGD
jgi:bifunctional enzyme CysN/CysC